MTTTVPNINSIPGNDQQQPFNGEQNKLAPLVWAAIISGAASLASAGIGYANNRNTNRQNREIMEQQNAFNSAEAVKAFNRETSYNDPSAQVQRYINAGLNPNLLMGNPSNTAQSPSASAGSAIPMQPFNPMLQFSQDFLNLAQARNINAQTDMIPEQREKLISEIKKIMSENDLARVTIGKIQAETALDYSQMNIIAKQCEQITESINNMRQDRKESQARINKILSDIQHNRDDSRYLRALSLALENDNSLWEFESKALKSDYEVLSENNKLNLIHLRSNTVKILENMDAALTAEHTENQNRQFASEMAKFWSERGNPLGIFISSIIGRWLTSYNANTTPLINGFNDVFRMAMKAKNPYRPRW